MIYAERKNLLQRHPFITALLITGIMVLAQNI